MVQDPTLAQLLEQSLAHNHDLRLALLRVEEARAAHGIQRADRFPRWRWAAATPAPACRVT
jgi:multidrug efflux system outer membrane protein